MKNRAEPTKGSALLSALFIMTLIAIAVTAMATRLQFDIYRTELSITHDKLYLASQEVTFWAMNTLLSQKNPFVTDRDDGKLVDFPTSLKKTYPGMILQGSLYDAQAFFNLNNLQDPKFHGLFFKLLEHTPHNDLAHRNHLINAIYEWITPFQAKQAKHPDLSFYLKQHPAYLPAYQPMKHISELRLIHGMDVDTYLALQPFMVTLPTMTPINLNTAPEQVLMTLSQGLNATEIGELLQARGTEGINNLNQITPLLEKLHIPINQVTTESEYYLSEAHVSSNDYSLTVYALLQRTQNKQKQVNIRVISQTLNVK